jgi:DNA repair exonuclease SbcCD ATPase subunit
MIQFQKILWRNFLSTGNQFTEVDFVAHQTTLIVGENGAGKSTILDALCFGLFGKAFRNINKPQLVNSINQKQCEVQVFFNLGKREFKIVRGLKPNVFEIYVDNELLSQEAASKDYQKYLEEKILKLNFKSFTQIVILGSASFTPFMQLPQGHRREVIEDILDIQIFTTMNSILKNRLATTKTEMTSFENEITLGKQAVKLQKDYIAKLEKDIEKRAQDNQLEIERTHRDIANATSSVTTIQSSIAELQQTLPDEKSLVSKRAEWSTLLKSLSERIKSANNNIDFYETHDECPTCSQSISDDLKEKAIEKHTHKIDEVQKAIDTLADKITGIEEKIEHITAVKETISAYQMQVIELNSDIITKQALIKKMTDDTDRDKIDTTELDSAKDQLKELAKSILEVSAKKSALSETYFYLEAAATLLKDTGIKTKVIRQYIPIINKLVNKYLSAMDFFVSFELDESFNESIKSRHRDDFSYASFSEGEKQRIDLALLFTWRTIAKMKNSVSTNLLLLDEVFDSSLDANGTDYVMNLLDTLDDDTHVFVITHKGDQLFDKFKSVIRVEKHQNFSRVIT